MRLFVGTFRLLRVLINLLVMRPIVKLLSPVQFSKLLRNPDAMKTLQIVDVREKYELPLANLKDIRTINLPLSTAEDWIPKLAQGEIIKKDAPTVVMCHHGVRSMNAANYFGKNSFSSFRPTLKLLLSFSPQITLRLSQQPGIH